MGEVSLGYDAPLCGPVRLDIDEACLDIDHHHRQDPPAQLWTQGVECNNCSRWKVWDSEEGHRPQVVVNSTWATDYEAISGGAPAKGGSTLANTAATSSCLRPVG